MKTKPQSLNVDPPVSEAQIKYAAGLTTAKPTEAPTVEDSQRYQCVKDGYWWRVRIGDGQQMVGQCHTETGAQRLAGDLLRAFRDGQWVAQNTLPVEAWQPTVQSINALPEALRKYVHDLETRCDPAGEVAANAFLREQVRQLEASNRRLRDALDGVKFDETSCRATCPVCNGAEPWPCARKAALERAKQGRA